MSHETRKLAEIDFPMYFSLMPDPGYDLDVLEENGIDGEFHLFHGNFSDIFSYSGDYSWGGHSSIEGKKFCSANEIPIFFLRCLDE